MLAFQLGWGRKLRSRKLLNGQGGECVVGSRAAVGAVRGCHSWRLGEAPPLEMFELCLDVKKASLRDLGIWEYFRQGRKQVQC